jgi:flagellar protein FliS
MKGYQKQINEYKMLEDEELVKSASPHQLIDILLQAVKTNIHSSKNHMEHKNISEKGAHISKAITIIEGLDALLDMEQGGEIAKNLDTVYESVVYLLLQANLQNDPELLDQAYKLIDEIHTAWQAIKPE